MGEGVRFIQSLVSAVLTVVFLALSGAFHSERAATAMIIGAVGSGIMFFVTVYTVALAAYDSHINTWENFLDTFAKADEEARTAMGFVFPKIRYTLKRGELRSEFENTGVPIEIFREFMTGSNDKYISPRRDWYTREKPEWAWIAIYQWLVDHGKVAPDSAAGNVSQLWIGNAYKQMYAYWMAGRRVTNLGIPDKVVYASDVEATPPLMESASDD
jgi:hypothetical protein